MTSFVPCKKNDANGFIFYVGLKPQTATGGFKANPTLAAGDVKISLDGGAFANLNTLPAVTPAAGKAVKVTLSQAETNADNLMIVFSDAAGAEWCDKLVNIHTVTKQLDDLATASALATAQTSIDDVPTNAELATALGTADDAVLAQVALVKAKTDNLPSDPADASDIASAFSTVNGTLSTIAGYIDSEVGTIVTQTSAASIRSAVGLASANLDTQLNALPTTAEVNAEVDTALADYDAPTKAELDTAIALVTAKTDSLTFTVAGQVDANIKSVAGTAVTGVGSEADPWGP
jgi:hypothetical protein